MLLLKTDGKNVKIAEQFDISGRLQELRQWTPDEFGHIYMYNTPYIWPYAGDIVRQPVILNFRDPRDLSCNQFHWALQHPVHAESADQAEARKQRVLAMGIDDYVLQLDNRPLFAAMQDLARIRERFEHRLLIVSYAQLCLDFEPMVSRLATFLHVTPTADQQRLIDLESPGKIKTNPQWIGQQWTGTDVLPGRHRTELRPDTVAKLNVKYGEVLKIMASLDPAHASLYQADLS